MNKDINELNDETLDSIIGGSGTYASDLSDFITNGRFFFSYSKVSSSTGKSEGSIGNSNLPVSDKGFQRMVERAKSYGGLTLTKQDGSSQYFSYDQLSKMI